MGEIVDLMAERESLRRQLYQERQERDRILDTVVRPLVEALDEMYDAHSDDCAEKYKGICGMAERARGALATAREHLGE